MPGKNQKLWARCFAKGADGTTTLLYAHDPETGETYHDTEKCKEQREKNMERVSCKASEIVSNDPKSALAYI